MQCPYCNSDSNVLDSRSTSEGIRRRRTCTSCKRRFTTYERAASPGLKVAKRSGKNEAFSANKLTACLTRICKRRPSVSISDIKRIVRDIEARLLDSGQKTVSSGHITELTLARLGEIDKVCQSRLAANYINEDGTLRIEASNDSPVEDEGQLGLFVESTDSSLS